MSRKSSGLHGGVTSHVLAQIFQLIADVIPHRAQVGPGLDSRWSSRALTLCTVSPVRALAVGATEETHLSRFEQMGPVV